MAQDNRGLEGKEAPLSQKSLRLSGLDPGQKPEALHHQPRNLNQTIGTSALIAMRPSPQA